MLFFCFWLLPEEFQSSLCQGHSKKLERRLSHNLSLLSPISIVCRFLNLSFFPLQDVLSLFLIPCFVRRAQSSLKLPSILFILISAHFLRILSLISAPSFMHCLCSCWFFLVIYEIISYNTVLSPWSSVLMFSFIHLVIMRIL